MNYEYIYKIHVMKIRFQKLVSSKNEMKFHFKDLSYLYKN